MGNRTDGYTSINPILLTILMGLREIYPERNVDTKIPFITGPLLIPYKVHIQFPCQLYLPIYIRFYLKFTLDSHTLLHSY